MSESLAGAAYASAIMARASDRRARAAFQAAALRLAPAGGAVLDFGAGPGLDARVYADRGLQVLAYEPDARMGEFFQRHCRAQIDGGRVQLDGRDYPSFLQRRADGPGFDLVTANFAPLNLVPDLPELFASLHALLRPGGRLLASVLNPFFVGDLQYGWWWRHAGALWREGRFSVPGSQGPIVRRSVADIAAQARPHFGLERASRRLRRFMFVQLRRAG